MSQMLKQEARSKKQEARSKKQEARSKKQDFRNCPHLPLSHSLTLPLSPAPDFCWVFQTNISW